ncbi:MAG: hypothetical protein J1E60_08145 [Christensenellaceae bacterium]|nr:hypothetical protein [Christensenellaceae bacterium]
MKRTQEQITEEIMRRSDEYRRRMKQRRNISAALCAPLALILVLSVTMLRLNPYRIPSESEMMDGGRFDILSWFQELLSKDIDSLPEAEPTQGGALDGESIHLPFVTVSEFMLPTDPSIPEGYPSPTNCIWWSFECAHVCSDEHSITIIELLNSAQLNDWPPIHESAPAFRDDVGYTISIHADDGSIKTTYTLIGCVLYMENGEPKYMNEENAEELHRIISDELYD